LRAELAAGRYRFGLLTRITLVDGEDVDLWSARDALVLKALAIVLAKHLPVSPRCTHVKGHGGAKAAVRQHSGFMSRTERSGQAPPGWIRTSSGGAAGWLAVLLGNKSDLTAPNRSARNLIEAGVRLS